MTDTKVKKVLIVEDDDDLRTAMSLRLRDDFDISVAQDGTSALVRARADRPDAILLDLGLPCGDGLNVLQNLATSPELRDIPVLVLTGRDGEKSQHEAMASGAWGYFHKPVDHDVLISALFSMTTQPLRARTCVLVVEDDRDVREGLVARLRAHDYVVVVAEDGVGALMAARKYKPQVVLLDLGLPCGGGMNVLRRMKEIDGLSDTPVVVLSARDSGEAAGPALSAGANAYLQKPADETELLEVLGGVQ